MTRRVLLWAERFWPTIGGVSISASTLLPGLRARGCEFIVVTLSDYFDLTEEDAYKGIPVYRFPFWTALATGHVGQVIELQRRIGKLKHAFAPDLIHINFLGPSVVFHSHTVDAHPAPLLVSLDSAFPNREIGRDSLVGRTLRSAHWTTCVSAARLAQARQRVPEITPRSCFIYQGRKLPPHPPGPLPLDPPWLLCLGRLDRVKGFDVALTAMASLVTRIPEARLVIAGDGPARPDLERQTPELGLQAVVNFVGWVPPMGCWR